MMAQNRKQRRHAAKTKPVAAAAPSFLDRTGLLQRALAAQQQGAVGDASRLYLACLVERPDHGVVWHYLALLVQRTGNLVLVEKLLRRALFCVATNAEAHSNRAAAFSDQGQEAAAERSARTATLLKPDYAKAYQNLGKALKQQGAAGPAVTHYRRALRLEPASALVLCNLGAALQDLDETDQALSCFAGALALEPFSAITLNNRGTSLQRAGDVAGAVRSCDRAVRVQPTYATAHTNLGMALLLQGDYRRGWPEYEWWRQSTAGNQPVRQFRQPVWRDQELAGRTLLLHAEQGLGDALQFARYATLLAGRGARVILEAHPPLKRLLSSVSGVDAAFARGEELPSFDFHLPLMSAPLRLQELACATPYLTADPGETARWRTRLAGLSGFRIGLVWAGNPRPHDPGANLVDRRRSMGLSQMAPLFDLPGVSFVSLQMGQPVQQIDTQPADRRPLTVLQEGDDFAVTAALIAQLDLVISVDTSVVHLAGALAKPVWILSRFDGCWRWLASGDLSPWYPTARLFRQKRPGDWEGVIARVVAELAQIIARSRNYD